MAFQYVSMTFSHECVEPDGIVKNVVASLPEGAGHFMAHDRLAKNVTQHSRISRHRVTN